MSFTSAARPPAFRLLPFLAALALAACGGESSAPAPASAGETEVAEVPAPAPPAPAPEVVPPGPRIEFEAPARDFGRVSDVEPLRHAFAFTNTGDQRLVVTDVHASCGCTTTTLEKTTYEPGERGEIEAVWEVKGVGVQRKTITVSTNGRPASVVLSVACEAEPFVRFEPAALQFGQVKQGEERILRARLTCADPALEILDVISTNPHLAAHVIDDPEDGGRLLEVMLLPSAPWGLITSLVKVQVRGRPDLEGELIEHGVQVSVSATLHGELVLDRTTFAVGRVDPGASFTSRLQVTRPGGGDFEIVEARLEQATPSTMAVRVEPLEGSEVSGYRLIVEGEAGPYLGLVRGTVLLRTDLESEPERRLSVMGIVRALDSRDH